MDNKKWIIAQYDEEAVLKVASEFHLSPIVARLLINRGIDTADKIREFLYDGPDALHSPLFLKDIDKAVSRINRALDNGEKIYIYGDYDVDGVTSTASLVSYLRGRGALCCYYIPDRTEEGYGINMAALDKIKEEGATLVITVDSGVTAVDEVDYAASIGLDVVITDHHECAETLPRAVAVVNPKRRDCPYPFKDLAGVGVVFKLICALSGEESLESVVSQYIDMVAIGTVADVMPLLGENRTIVRRGLLALQRPLRPGVRAIFSCVGVTGEKKVTSGSIGFSIAPRINAAGRIGCARRAVELFLTHDNVEAANLSQELCDANLLRQNEENTIMTWARSILEERGFCSQKERIIVLAGDGWHNGVIGIVASRLCDLYNCPAILISFDGDSGRGSGRSIPGFNLYEALSDMSDCLEKFGGHELAAGLSINRDKLNAFCEKIGGYAKKRISTEDMIPSVGVDVFLKEEELTLDTFRDISRLEPFGVCNPVPQFGITDVKIDDIVPISNDKHLRLTITKGDKSITAFMFSTPPDNFPLCRGDRADVVCCLDASSYRGRSSLKLIIKDIRLNGELHSELKRSRALYERICLGTDLSPAESELALPERDDFVAVYRFLRQNSNGGTYRGAAGSLNREIGWYSRRSISYCRTMLCLDVLEELGLAVWAMERGRVTVTLSNVDGKVDLNNSAILGGLKKIRDGECAK